MYALVITIKHCKHLKEGRLLSNYADQFRRAVVSIASWRGNAQHKLARLHFVRATKEEAKAVHQANLRENNWRADGQGPSSWYARHTADGYGAYQQFQNSYGFGMH